MLILLTGSNNSGKSRCAERIASRIDAKKFYAATMIPWGEEGQARKEKHIRQRDGLGFITVECPCDLSQVSCGSGDLVLLEDVSNLLANLIFERHDENAEANAERQITSLHSRCATLIAVTIGGLTSDGSDGETARYIDALNRLNKRLEESAGCVISMEEHQPHVTKGECPWLG